MSLFSRRRRSSRLSEPRRGRRSDDQDTPAQHMGRGTVVASDPVTGTMVPNLGAGDSTHDWGQPAVKQPKFPYSTTSLARLQTCDPRLKKLFMAVADRYDVSIIEGYRPLERQLELYNNGKSKVKMGKHNSTPSKAVDAAPYPIDWNDPEQFIEFGYFVMGVAHGMGIPLRWGGDWDGDMDMSDQTFNDRVHFEIDE